MKYFIDTNIYKKLFEPTPSVEYFNKLIELVVREKKIIVIFPKITQVEVYREIVLGTLDKDAKKLIVNVPVIIPFKGDKEKTISQIKKEFNDSLDKESEKIENYKEILIEKRKMASSLFNEYKKQTLSFSEEGLVLKGEERRSKKYPPGKGKTDPLGDELAWEILLKNCINDDLTIVSTDGGFQDSIDFNSNKINPILLDEWNSISDHKVSLLKDLGSMFEEADPSYKKPIKNIRKEKSENTSALRPTWFPVNLAPSPSLSTGSSGPYWGSVSGSASTSTSTAISGPSASWTSSLSTSPPLSSLVCSNCGRLISSNGSYLVQNGLILCPMCAPYGF